MPSPTTGWPDSVAVMAALIGGATSFIVTVLTKEQKTSEFRQAWIDALRDDISEYLAVASTLRHASVVKTELGQNIKDFEAFIDARHEAIARMLTCFYRINLRLNPREHAVLAGKLEALRNYLNERGTENDASEIQLLVAALVDEAQTVLKNEWRRVKRGELIYRITKYGSLVLFALAVLFVVWLVPGYIGLVVAAVFGLVVGALLGRFSKSY